MINILVTGGNGNIGKMIKKNLSNKYNIVCLSRHDLNVLKLKDIETYLNSNTFDILVHSAILGGRRTKEETSDITHNNLVMLENLLFFADRFKMIINFDSAAIYDRSTNILNRKEEDIFTVPMDFYGFSKYVIYQRSLCYSHFYNFRIFNIFHENEEPERFIKSCFLSKKNNTSVTILEDKFFDFVYEDDFIKVVEFYFKNINNTSVLHKTINICYKEKYKLSDIAKIILENENKIIVLKSENVFNYSGNGNKLENLDLKLDGLQVSLLKYENRIYI